MDNNSKPKNVPLEDALKESDSVRVSQTQIFQRGVDTRSGTFYASDVSTPRVEFGKFANSSGSGYGLKVSKPGYNVQTATSDQLAFNSDQNVFKIVKKVTGSFNMPNTGARQQNQITITHDMGYVPLIQASVAFTANSETGAGTFLLPYQTIGQTAANPLMFSVANFVVIYNVTSTSVVINYGVWVSGNMTGTVTCYVLQETST